MATEQTTFEFPDEIEVKSDRAGSRIVAPETEIEIVDDTPPEDRNRKPMAEPPKDVTDDELSKYDESVQSRIKHFSKGYHEERRAKEAAQREREEAVRLAKQVVEENKKLKGSLHEGQTALIEQAKQVAANDVEKARAKFKSAYEAGDPEALASAQDEMTAARLKSDRVANFRPTPVQLTEDSVQTTQRPQQPDMDPELKSWTERNPWFGAKKGMTAYAVGLHDDVVDEGYTAGSAKYYERIDTIMRDRFADEFEPASPADAPPQRTKSNVVAPATRSTAPKKVVLTKSQVDLAKRLGVPLELYAKQVVAEQMRK
ncbi:hypothetical protein UFOVP48_90 [uncultured Caudovirales phage]|uniref:Uncharacterized protein n=1 Tax=uncultured Caudovirales phage TaxID=2100421 RepID=A0A6J5KRJ7_9CAUD|nr:hypothetical protein UFOVP48_90 [uncultured Caudovirales phage]